MTGSELPLGSMESIAYAEAAIAAPPQLLAGNAWLFTQGADADALATGANQWFRKRFAMLNDSGVLDKYSAKQIQARSKGYHVEVHVSKGKIIFPVARGPAKKLLQFLNEELFRGAITEALYETNSKRKAY